MFGTCGLAVSGSRYEKSQALRNLRLCSLGGLGIGRSEKVPALRANPSGAWTVGKQACLKAFGKALLTSRRHHGVGCSPASIAHGSMPAPLGSPTHFKFTQSLTFRRSDQRCSKADLSCLQRNASSDANPELRISFASCIQDAESLIADAKTRVSVQLTDF